MTTLEAIKNRHSVRSYLDRAIPEDIVAQLEAEIQACNEEGGLHFQLITDEPKAFDGFMAHYGKFSGVRNYIALIGPKRNDLDEAVGYYGERVALRAQMLGLNSCWVAMSYSKRNCAAVIAKGEKLVCVLAIGYGAVQGVAHKSKPMASVCQTDGALPDWFRSGVEAALLAPTAVNQQKFQFSLNSDVVTAKSTGGFYSKVDLGIVKYHFEIGAEAHPFCWA